MEEHRNVLWGVEEGSLRKTNENLQTQCDRSQEKEFQKKTIISKDKLTDLIIFQHSLSQERAPQSPHDSSQNKESFLTPLTPLPTMCNALPTVFNVPSKSLSNPSTALIPYLASAVYLKSISPLAQITTVFSTLHTSIVAHFNLSSPPPHYCWCNLLIFNLNETIQGLYFCF